MRSFNRIPCIGADKTGRSSLHEALKPWGLTSLHWSPEDGWSTRERKATAHTISDEMKAALKAGEPMLGRRDDYDACSDIGPIIRGFEQADRQIPG